MEEVIKIIMERDGMSYEDAKELVINTAAECADCEGDYEAVEEVLSYNLGLEMDYIMDILF